MTPRAAERTIVTSAVVVGGIYGYSYWKKTTKTHPQTFAVAFGAAFMVLALLAQVTPGIAAALAMLVIVAELLSQGTGLFTSLTKQVTQNG